MPSTGDLIWQVLYRFCATVVLVFASVGFAMGVGLIVSSAPTLRFFRVVNRWVSTRGAFRQLEMPRSAEGFFHRHRRPLGWILIAGGIFSTLGLLLGVDAAALGKALATGDRVLPVAIVAASLKWVLILGSVAGVAVGAMLCFFPNALAGLERHANRWFSARRVLQGGDDMRLTLDRLVESHPGPSGWILSCTSLGAVAYAVTLLFARA